MGFVTITIVLMSCGSSKKSVSIQNESIDTTVPFSKSKYKTDKNNFRAKNLVNSRDFATAKKIALLNAQVEIANTIKNTLKNVTSQYSSEKSIGKSEEFEDGVKTSLSQTLTGTRILGEKIYKESNGTYNYWIAIEIPTQSVISGINSKLSNNAKLNFDFDQHKFQEIFDKEMEKLEKE